MPSSLAFAPALALGALALEAMIGYPSALFARIGHPVTWIGALIITALEQRLNRPEETFARRRLMGFALVGQLLFVCGAISLLVALVFVGPLGLVLQAILAASLPAQRSLHTHVMAVGARFGDRRVGRRPPRRLHDRRARCVGAGRSGGRARD